MQEMGVVALLVRGHAEMLETLIRVVERIEAGLPIITRGGAGPRDGD